MAIASPLNLQQITTGVRSLGVAVTRAQVSANRSAGILVNRNKIKRKLVFGDRLSFDRRRERVRRRRQEDIIESSTIGGFIKNRGLALANSTRGFLGRIMDFLGTLLVGWLLNNLPTIISMAQELMARIGRLVNILGGFVTNIGKSLQSFGKVLGAVGQNIINFDFLDSNKRVQTAMDDLNSVFDDMSTQIDDGLKLFTTPLGEGLVSGEDAAPTGTDYTTQPPVPSEAGSPSEETTKGGKVVSPQAVYSYLKSKGMSHIHALGIAANIKGESGFRIDAQEEGNTKSGVGLFQYSNVRKPAFLKAVPDYKTNWKAQIDYALNEDRAPEYLKKQFSSPEAAAYWWMDEWERPSAGVYSGRNKKHNDFIKSFKPGATPAASAQITPAPAPAQSRSAVTTSVVDQFKGKPGGASGIVTSERGMRDGRMHHGIDIAPAGRGYYTALKLSGRVNLVAFDSGGYGHYVDIKSGNMIYRFAHLAKVFVKQGQSYNGETIGEIGTTGGSTGIHLHFEVRPVGAGLYGKGSIDPRPYIGLLSIGKQLTGVAGQPAQIAAPTPAQIAAQPSQRRQQLSSQVTPQRVGQKVVIIDNMQPPQIPSAPPSGGGSMGFIPIQTNSLNSYITKKLLLDLAYT
jgi:murein DD-endopeptidase MepM/ murein hydrolase activator NlpD